MNLVWAALILGSLLVAFVRAALGDALVLEQLSRALFDNAKWGAELAIGLTGSLCFWMGMLAIAERAGMVAWLARGLEPLLARLMPGVPRGDAAFGHMTLNIAANMLGLDNAATPMGLKAMESLQRLNPVPDTATNAQIMFLVINTASVTLLPISVLVYRAEAGASFPALMMAPLLMAAVVSTFAGVLMTGVIQRLSWRDPVLLGGSAGMVALVLAVLLMPPSGAALGNILLLGVVAVFLVVGLARRVPVYEVFIEGAKDGFHTAIRIIPYLVAMLVAVGLLRASGVLELFVQGVAGLCQAVGMDTAFAPALPTGVMKSFNGSASRALMLDVMRTEGADSFAGYVASVFQGSSETTLYVLAVYFGYVGIRRIRHAMACGLFADLVAVVSGVLFAYLFYPA